MILGLKRITQDKKNRTFKRVYVQIREMELIFINKFSNKTKDSKTHSNSLIISIMSS